jgi:hypothetical protein
VILCDIEVIVADSIRMQGRVVFLHPLANYAVVQYDPSLVDVPVQSATLSTEMIEQGIEVIFVGFRESSRPTVLRTTVSGVDSLRHDRATSYRAANVDAINVDSEPVYQETSGVLIGHDGAVQAVWLEYSTRKASFGRAARSIASIVSQLRVNIVPNLNLLRRHILGPNHPKRHQKNFQQHHQ